jgi:hypothetical protein
MSLALIVNKRYSIQHDGPHVIDKGSCLPCYIEYPSDLLVGLSRGLDFDPVGDRLAAYISALNARYQNETVRQLFEVTFPLSRSDGRSTACNRVFPIHRVS